MRMPDGMNPALDRPGDRALEKPPKVWLRRVWRAWVVFLTVAGVVTAVAIWTGVGAPHDSFLHAERLPWSDEPLAPLPGVHATFEVASMASDPEGIWPGWSAPFGFAVLAVLALCAAMTLIVDRGRHRRFEPLAVIAAWLAVAGAFELARIMDAVSSWGNWDTPPFAAWRSVPVALQSTLMLLIAAAVIAVLALIRIARRPQRRGIELAGYALVAVAWALLLLDAGVLAPSHLYGSVGRRPVELPAAVDSRTWNIRHELEGHVTLTADGVADVRFLADSAASHVDDGRRQAFAWSGRTSDPAFLDAVDEMVARLPHRRGEFVGGGLEHDPVMLSIDAAVPFGEARLLLRQLRERGVWRIWIETAPRVASGSRRWLQFFLPVAATLAVAGDATPEPAVLELVAAAGGTRSAEARWRGQTYIDAGAAAAAGDLVDALVFSVIVRVSDHVHWSDVVHAQDLLNHVGVFEF